ncbi:hypothetical protein SCLARK_001827 [Spiroplasma clarkii]|nr:hypothetical protein SCLARK_001827 [Spiroplasma clarkii]
MGKEGKTLTNNVRKFLYIFYMSLERPFKPSRRKRKGVDPKVQSILRTNNIVKKFYKRPELEITDFKNIKVIEFNTEDNLKIVGYDYEPNPGSNKWVIACHWFAGHKNCSLHHAKVFAEMGWNILTFDFRGHGDSQKATTTAIDEYKDLLAAIAWLKKNKKVDELALMGTSMGAFVVNYVSVRYANMLKELNLKFVISDCTYNNIGTLFKHVKLVYLKFIRKRKSNAFVVKQIKVHQKKNPHTDYINTDVLKLVNKGSDPLVPTFFTHSLDDAVTPPTDSYELMLARSKKIDLDHYKIYTNSMHTQAIRLHFKSFNYEIASFINKFSPDEKRFKELVDKWELLTITDKKIKNR